MIDNETSSRLSIPKLPIKLKGQENYAPWASKVRMFLKTLDISGYSWWDIIDGTYKQPVARDISTGKEKEKEGSSSETESILAKARSWEKANLTIYLLLAKNCEEDVCSHIDSIEDAAECWKALKELYEGKTITNHSILLASLTKFSFDDRSSTINEHILEYERRWNTMRSIITSCPIKNENNGITRALREIAKCDEAKAEFLLQSLSSYYSNTVENIKAKEKYAYGDVVIKLREYIPARQKGRKKETSTGTSASGDQVVLSANKNSGKTCNYCKKNKGWSGKGHEEADCWTKKREEKKGQPEAKKTEKDNESESENNSDDDMLCLVTDLVLSTTEISSQNHDWQYDDDASCRK
jgi:hypothetical protein